MLAWKSRLVALLTLGAILQPALLSTAWAQRNNNNNDAAAAAAGGLLLGTMIGAAIQNNNNNNSNNNNNQNNFRNNRRQDEYEYYDDEPGMNYVPVQQYQVGEVRLLTDGTTGRWNGYTWEIIARPAAPNAAKAETKKKKTYPKAPERQTIESASNEVKIKVRPATATDLKRIKKTLQTQMEKINEELLDDLSEVQLDDVAVRQQLQQLTSSPEDQNRILTAVSRGRSSELYSTVFEVTKDATVAGEWSARLALTELTNELSTLIDDGTITGADIKSLNRDLKKLELDKKSKRAVERSLEQLTKLAEVSELVSKPKGGKAESISLAQTSGQVITVPTLEPGAVLSVGADVYLVGVGSGGELGLSDGGLADSLEFPTYTEGASTESTAEKLPYKGGFVFMNPEGSGGSAYYKWNGTEHKLAPGERKQHYSTEDEEVSYNRGGKDGGKWTKPVGWKPGTYVFAADDGEWALKVRKYKVTVDNTANAQPFNIVWQDEKVKIPANQKKELTSQWPAYVRFDRGNHSQKRIDFWDGTKPTYVVGLNAEDGLWDLFDATAVADAE